MSARAKSPPRHRRVEGRRAEGTSSALAAVVDVADPSDIAGGSSLTRIEGRSPASIAWRRIRRDRITMASLCLVVLLLLLAIAAPFLKAFNVIDPSTPHPELVQGVGSIPTGPFSGASTAHWLGVVPGVGQDEIGRAHV